MLFEKVQLEDNEVILETVRKHWFVIFSSLFGFFMIALLPFAFLLLFVFLPDEVNLFKIHPDNFLALFSFGTASWTLLTIMSAFMVWTNYYLDLWIITDRRVIVIEQLSFFHRNVGVFRLERLQDIEVKTVGLLQTFLNYGSLNAQTAGHFESNFASSGLPDPRHLQSVIQKATDERLEKLHNASTLTH